MGLRDDMLALPLEQRFAYDAEHNIFFVNFEGLNVRSQTEIDGIRRLVEARLEPLGRKVYAIENYDNFTLNPDLLDAYMDMVRDVTERFYVRATRYTTSSFTRAHIGDALEQRSVTPGFFNTPEEALFQLQKAAE
jgi:propionate CoA-transferase